jgi:hypothetical protein
VFGGVHEILIGAQQNDFVSDAQLRDQRVDCANLHARSTAQIPEMGRGNMVPSVWLYQCQRRETLDDFCACLGAREALEKFLQHQPRGDDDVGASEGFLEGLNLGHFNLDIASECQRPDARIDEKRHLRERSAL